MNSVTDKNNYTLREFINELEQLSDGGKNDNLEVVVLNYDDEFFPIGWFGIDEYYPKDELDENNPQHPTKCIMIQY